MLASNRVECCPEHFQMQAATIKGRGGDWQVFIDLDLIDSSNQNRTFCDNHHKKIGVATCI